LRLALIALFLSGCCDYEQYEKPYGDDCVKHDGLYRCWNIHAPEGLTGSVPLVIDLHGLGSSATRQRNLSGFEALADSEGFIAVWPHGLCESWNAGRRCCDPAAMDRIDDVGFIRKMVEQISEQHDIDAGRVYVTGLSNGCAMAQRLANQASDIVTASACMSLHLLMDPDPDYTPVSVMTIMGDDDDLYFPGKFRGALSTFETWRDMNGCTESFTETWSSGDSVAWTYETCDEGTEISLVTIDGGGHVLYIDEETDIDTTRLAWDFMSRFTK
jgi:polyhydroxybutyrate depolymerase